MTGEDDSRLPTVRSEIEIIPPDRDIMLQQVDRLESLHCRSVVSVDPNETTNGVRILIVVDNLTSLVVAESPLTIKL